MKFWLNWVNVYGERFCLFVDTVELDWWADSTEFEWGPCEFFAAAAAFFAAVAFCVATALA